MRSEWDILLVNYHVFILWIPHDAMLRFNFDKENSDADHI